MNTFQRQKRQSNAAYLRLALAVSANIASFICSIMSFEVVAFDMSFGTASNFLLLQLEDGLDIPRSRVEDSQKSDSGLPRAGRILSLEALKPPWTPDRTDGRPG